jgi:hypothetical protein
LGSYSAICQTKINFVGAGYAAISGRLTVTPGAQYVLSGFFYTAGLQSGFLYLDLDDVGFDVHVFAQNKVSQWQFAYRTFTPTNNYVNVRLIRDGSVAAGSGNVFVNQFGFVDGVAVTPLSAFSPPLQFLNQAVGWYLFVLHLVSQFSAGTSDVNHVQRRVLVRRTRKFGLLRDLEERPDFGEIFGRDAGASPQTPGRPSTGCAEWVSWL